MDWTECISTAVSYIEDNITEELTVGDIAKRAMISPFYFQKGFAMLCGFTAGDYIKKRRLALAAGELMDGDSKVIDIAFKYGYDSPDSFTKAFTRFHGSTPSAVRKGEGTIKSFAALKIKLTLEGGYGMDYKLMKKDQFTIIGIAKTFTYEEGPAKIPALWAEFMQEGKGELICPMYGVNIDESMGNNAFEYLIADNYSPERDIPEGFVTRVIPAHAWAVFPCKGPMPKVMQETMKKIFSEWLPQGGYDFAAGYNIEMYADPTQYPKGTEDENYYAEIWIPVKQK